MRGYLLIIYFTIKNQKSAKVFFWKTFIEEAFAQKFPKGAIAEYTLDTVL